MARLPKCAFACLTYAGIMAASGCQAHNQDDRIQGKMFYRAAPKPAPQANTMSVGRYGHNADYSRWNERGSGNSDAGYESSASVGRYGKTTDTSVWSATDVGGEPIDNASISNRYGDNGGSSLGVSGDGASSSEYGESSSRYGNASP